MSLYPVKLRQLLADLSKSGAMDAMAAKAAASPVQAPVDGRRRIALTSSEVQRALQLEVGEGRYHVRIAIPENVSSLWLPDETMLEIYGYDEGTPVGVPRPLSELTGYLACAIEAELYHALLGAMGCTIPNT